MRFILLILSSLLTFQLSAQQTFPYQDSLLKQARISLDTLTSTHFYGRGYQKNGHKIAADYLEKRFKKIGLQPVDGSYQQDFEFKLNVIYEAELSLDETTFEAGKDFIAHALSGTGTLDLKVVDVGYGLKIKAKKVRNNIVVIRAGLPPSIQDDPRKRELYAERGRDDYKLQLLGKANPAGVIILRKKLTASLRPEVLPFPILELRTDAYPSKKVKTGHMRVESKLQTIQTQNVLGYLQGTAGSDSVIVLTAHYDHLGGYSGAIFRGANDNASGTTMLLSIAEHFSKNPPRHNMLFIGFGAEEAGLQGSAFYALQQPLIPLSRMKFLLNLDLMGNGVDGIMAVGGKDFPEIFDSLVALNDEMGAVPRVRARQNAPNSDHYFFLKNGVPGFFIYTMGGPPHYHDVNDNAQNLLFSKYVEVRQLLIAFLGEM